MSLKSLIQWLLDSRTTPEEAGHNAMPINIANATNLTMDVGAEGSYTAPADGYLSLMVEPGGNINLWGQILPISSFPIQNVQGKLFVPMAKGMEVRYYINGTVSLAKFLKTIGGGYNILVWRALSCLRPSFNYSPRNSWPAKVTGFPTNPIRQLPRRISHHQKQGIGSTLSLLVTGGFALRLLPHKSCSATENYGKACVQKNQHIRAFQCLSQRGGQLLTYCHQTQQTLMCSLFRVLATRANVLAGGVTC